MALVLIADDDDFVIELVRFRLEIDGHTVVGATDGRTAIDQMRRLKPDLVILDTMMPILDGYEVLQEMAADTELAGIPVLKLTGRKSEADIVRAFRSGASDYMTKPFAPEELAVRVDALMARSIGYAKAA